ncbi:MAG: MopE-related protein, partial [Saprospiraceae bacterium]
MNFLFYLLAALSLHANNTPANSPAGVTDVLIWDGEAGDNLWTTAANWSGDTIPNLHSDVIIPLEDTVLLNANQMTVVESVILRNGAHLEIAAGDTLQTIGGGSSGSDGFRLEGAVDTVTTLIVNGVLTISNPNGDGLDLNEYCFVHVTSTGVLASYNATGDGAEIGSSWLNDGIVIIEGSMSNGINGSGTVADAGSMITNNGTMTITNTGNNGIRLIGDLDMNNNGTLISFGHEADAFTSTAGKFTNNGLLWASGRFKTEHLIHASGGTVSVYDTDEPIEFSQGLNFSTNTLILDIEGDTIGEYDQVFVTSGGIDLDTTTLVLQGSYVPQAGDVFLILDNEVGAPAADQESFVGLPEGAVINFNGVDLYITYNAGDENDIALVTNNLELVDMDMDGSPALYDCDDNDPTISPGEPEIPNNDVDENCDGITLVIDEDEDGFNSSVDCDDTNPMINTDATEICDGVDNNCDGNIDEGFAASTYYLDADMDGFGIPDSFIVTCSPITAGYSIDSTDCDDSNPAINPDAPEVCDGVDNNCDGNTDEGLPDFTYYLDLDEDGFGNDTVFLTTCSSTEPDGYVVSLGDCDDENTAVYPNAPEICDGFDNDCNGETDEGLTFTVYYIDADGDGYGSLNLTINSCSLVPDPGYVANFDDCNDDDSDINPDAPETCDGIDNNCDGNTDEGLPTTIYFADADMDGFGDANAPLDSCMMMPPPMGYVANSDDCDDTNQNINPDAMEITGNNVDEDCDGTAQSFADEDMDGFFDFEDCDDTNPDINPDATEICDGIDNDCDGEIDNGLDQFVYYVDMDEDGFGNPDSSVDTCWTVVPIGYAVNGDDCDDSNADINPDATEIPNNDIDEDCDGTAQVIDEDMDGSNSDEDCDDNNDTVYPGAPEICDELDNNCDGDIDEGLDSFVYYVDADADGFGDLNSTTIMSCTTVAPDGYSAVPTDCDDTNPAINPDAIEIPDNGIDEDCMDGDLVG